MVFLEILVIPAGPPERQGKHKHRTPVRRNCSVSQPCRQQFSFSHFSLNPFGLSPTGWLQWVQDTALPLHTETPLMAVLVPGSVAHNVFSALLYSKVRLRLKFPAWAGTYLAIPSASRQSEKAGKTFRVGWATLLPGTSIGAARATSEKQVALGETPKGGWRTWFLGNHA